jgi:hypothetical protein
MKKIFFTILLFLFGTILFGQENKMKNVETILAEIKDNFALDKRTSVFEIKFQELNGEINFSGETNLKLVKDQLLKRIKESGMIYKDEIKLLPSEELSVNYYGIINLSVANIRSKPDDRAELTSQALLGTPVKILKKSSGFFLVQTPDEYIGWTDDEGVSSMNKNQLDDWLTSEKIIYTTEFGFSYSEPNEYSVRVSDLTAGNVLMKLGEQKDFINTKYPDGRIAFIKKTECQNFSKWINKKDATSEDILHTAQSFMGIPYLWGGTSAKGMDCSGFTKTVYFLNGIILERDANQQSFQGELVDTKDGFEKLLPGDLLFFGSQATDSTKERITHVGIYMGDYKFIHASGKVKINSFDRNASNFSEYRLKHFVRAKRYLNSIGKNNLYTIMQNKFYRGDF